MKPFRTAESLSRFSTATGDIQCFSAVVPDGDVLDSVLLLVAMDKCGDDAGDWSSLVSLGFSTVPVEVENGIALGVGVP